jgi:hypothetical protein
MIERLALPASDTGPTPLASWVERLSGLGLEVSVVRESPGVSWVVVNDPRLRGYAVTEGTIVEAINFEIDEAEPASALRSLEGVAAALSWELHEDDGEEPDD